LAWTIEWSDSAKKQLRKLDRQGSRQIADYLDTKAASNPRAVGKALTAQFASLWRYRAGDFRIVASIEDARLVVLIVRAGHRRDGRAGDPYCPEPHRPGCAASQRKKFRKSSSYVLVDESVDIREGSPRPEPSSRCSRWRPTIMQRR